MDDVKENAIRDKEVVMKRLRYSLLFVSMMGVSAFCFGQNTHIIVVGHPRVFCETELRKGEAVVDALRRTAPRDGEIWLVVARRVDAWWSVARGRSERENLVNEAAGEIERARGYPVVYDPSLTVAEIQRRIQSRSGGQASPTVVWIASTRIGESLPQEVRSAPPIYEDSVVIKKEIERADGVITPDSRSVWKLFFFLTFGLVGVIALVVISVCKQRAREEDLERWINEMKERVLENGDANINSTPRDPVEADWNPDEQAHSGRPSRRIFLNLLLILLILGVSVSVLAQDYRALDVSLSDAVRLRETARQEIALQILNKRSVDLWFFGDSVRYAGRISSLRQLDSVFNELPGDGKTRLAEALTHLKTIVDNARSKGRKPLVTIYTDYVEDDANNIALATGLVFPAGRTDTAKSHIAMPRAEQFSFREGLVFGGFGVALVSVIVHSIRRARQKKAPPMNARRVAVSVGDATVTKSIEEMTARGVKVGSAFDADLRLFDTDTYGLKLSRENGHLQLLLTRLDRKQEPIQITLS